MRTPNNTTTLQDLAAENAMLLEEIQVARRAADIMAKLVVEQFVKIEEVLLQLEKEATTEQRLRAQLAIELRETERRERDLAEARRAADAANRAKSTFLANMSHELRTPLNAILGYSEMLKEEAQDGGQEEFIPDLDRIHAAGKHLLTLINDVLDLSKIEAGKMDLYLETFDVAGAIEGVVCTAEPLVRQKANRIEVNCPAGLGAMHADLTKVRQCLFNLISNSGKFTENGVITLEVRRETRDGAEWFVFRVADTGIGMTPEQLAKLFQPFTQADASTTRKFGGTGLGLTITHHMCSMMGGRIEVASQLNVGTTFTIYLPAVVEKKAEPAPGPAIEPPSGAAAPGPGLTILVIDDDPVARNLLERFLSGEGYRVVTAADGKEGVKLARALHPAAITLDVLMPQTDGWAVLVELKADPVTAEIPTIMISIVDNMSMGFALGATEYLTKPIDRERLLQVLNKILHDTRKPILVVEDDATTRDMLRRVLEKEGWPVDEAENGRVGLKCLEARPPGLILLDLMMPEMDGFQFIEALHRRAEWSLIPVVVVTAKDLTQQERMRLSGCVEQILQKGAYTREELLKQVRSAIQNLTGGPAPR